MMDIKDAEIHIAENNVIASRQKKKVILKITIVLLIALAVILAGLIGWIWLTGWLEELCPPPMPFPNDF